MTSSCFTLGRPSIKDAATSAPPQTEMPQEARQSCALWTFPKTGKISQADKTTGYMARGASIVNCDLMRALAVSTFDRQALAVKNWTEARERRRSWNCRWFKVGCT